MFKVIQGIPALQSNGVYRKLAALKPEPACLAQATRFSDVYTPDPSTWQPCDFSSYGSPIRDQGTFGSCTGHAGVTALDYTRRMMGQDPVTLSCTFPYGLVNGGRDQGASVSSVLQALKQYGTCTQAEVGTDVIYKQQFPATAFETATKYKVTEAFLCRTFEELCEALNRGFPIAFGIQIGQNFNRLDKNGVAPVPDMVIGGHALCGVGLSSPRSGDWLIKTQNSWSKNWGLKGFCFLTRGHFDRMVDAYAIQYAVNQNPPPPVPKIAAEKPCKKVSVPSCDLTEVVKNMQVIKEKLIEALENKEVQLPKFEVVPEPIPAPPEDFVVIPEAAPEQLKIEKVVAENPAFELEATEFTSTTLELEPKIEGTLIKDGENFAFTPADPVAAAEVIHEVLKEAPECVPDPVTPPLPPPTPVVPPLPPPTPVVPEKSLAAQLADTPPTPTHKVEHQGRKKNRHKH